jgi:hypothetical protein
MEGPLSGGLAAPDRPRGPERLPGPAPREDIEGGAEAAEGEGGIFRSTRYLPITKEGPHDILDGRGGISGKRVGLVAQRELRWDSDSCESSLGTLLTFLFYHVNRCLGGQ